MSEKQETVGPIVVGIDGSAGSAAALRWAILLAQAADAEVLAVHLFEPPEYDIRPVGLPRATLNEADWREEIRAELEGTWCQPLVAAGVRHRTRVEVGRAGPCLASIAKEEGAFLIVTGRPGLSGLAELAQGSVSSYLTHHASCTIVVVPEEEVADSATGSAAGQRLAERRQPATQERRTWIL